MDVVKGQPTFYDKINVINGFKMNMKRNWLFCCLTTVLEWNLVAKKAIVTCCIVMEILFYLRVTIVLKSLLLYPIEIGQLAVTR